MSDSVELSAWFRSLFERAEDEQDALEQAHTHLQNAGLLNRVRLHTYMCKRGCQLATVFKIDGKILCAVRDYKFSPGLNEQVSVASARRENTLDGDRHWPAHVYDVQQLAQFGTAEAPSGMDMNCRHHRGTVFADDILRAVDGVEAGHPGKPTRL